MKFPGMIAVKCLIGLRRKSHRNVTLLLLVILFSLVRNAGADTLVLVHGFASSGKEWHSSGILQILDRSGYRYQGNATVKPSGVVVPKIATTRQLPNISLTVDLPWYRPVEIQAALLTGYLNGIYQQRKEPLTLVGHSAGGVVARAWLTSRQALPVSALMTIAAPHLGAPLSRFAESVGRTPLNIMVDQVTGIDLKKARELLHDLRPEKPGRYLYWLNSQPHPDIRYFSVIRRSDSIRKGDYVVPPRSQDMNWVRGIAGRSASLLTIGNHYLDPRDGQYILQLLQHSAADK